MKPKFPIFSSSRGLCGGKNVVLEDLTTDEPFIYRAEEGELTDLVLFSVSSGTVTVPDLQKVLETRFGKDCSSENSVIGFTPEANVVIRVAPVKDTYYNEGATSCVKKRTLLALDAKRGFQAIAQVLPADFKSQPYGHFPERPAPKK